MLTVSDISRLDPDDIDALLPLARSAFIATYSDHNPADIMAEYISTAFTRQQFSREMQDPNNLFLGIHEQGDLAGFVKLRSGPVPADVSLLPAIEIERIYTRAGHTGRGIGRKLMDAAVAAATERHYKAVWLGVWQQNHRAVAFYEREGFRIVGTKVFMMGSDAQTDHIMVRSINGSEQPSQQ